MAAYQGNIGITEMMAIYGQGNADQISRLDAIVETNDFDQYRALVKEVLGIDLYPRQPE